MNFTILLTFFPPFQYVDICRNLKYWGYIQFQPCICDFPEPGTKVLVSAGQSELNLRVVDDIQGIIKEGNFKVTLMRCWRITMAQVIEIFST